MNSAKLQLVIEFDVSDLPTLTEIFKKFKVKTKPTRPSVDEIQLADALAAGKFKQSPKPARPSADEIEQMIIKKALLDAKAIDRGELKTRPLEELLAELQAESTADNYEKAMAA